MPSNAGTARIAITRDRLAFLHGDLCLSTRVVATIFGVTETDIAEARKRLGVKGCHGFFGEITRSTFHELANILGFDPNELNSVETRGQCHRMRGVLGPAIVRLASEGTPPWSALDRFLERLPAVQAAAEARVTAPRLEFLYGDLGASQSEIMAILDTTASNVTSSTTPRSMSAFWTSLLADSAPMVGPSTGTSAP